MHHGKNLLAVLTIVQNEPVMLPVWLRHYAQQGVAPRDTYILDHESVGDGAAVLDSYARLGGDYNLVPVRHELGFDHRWLADTLGAFQKFLLQSYRYVLVVEVDECVAPDPRLTPHNLAQFVETLPHQPTVVRTHGWEIVHRLDEEPDAEFTLPLLQQRRYWYNTKQYSKAILASYPLYWRDGLHTAVNVPRGQEPDRRLLLLHLHKVDYNYAFDRHRANAAQRWSPRDRLEGVGVGRQNLIIDPEMLKLWFASHADDTRQRSQLALIPREIKDKIPL